MKNNFYWAVNPNSATPVASSSMTGLPGTPGSWRCSNG
jgi:hypothetical protein